MHPSGPLPLDIQRPTLHQYSQSTHCIIAVSIVQGLVSHQPSGNSVAGDTVNSGRLGCEKRCKSWRTVLA